MATIQTQDLRVAIEPSIPTPDIDFGPTPALPANAILLTQAGLRAIGAYPPRSGQDWDCGLFVCTVIAGVETALDLSSMTVQATYWDPVTMVSNELTVALGAADGQIDLSFAAADLPTAGMYRFVVTGTQTEIFGLCNGWLEILPAVPS